MLDCANHALGHLSEPDIIKLANIDVPLDKIRDRRSPSTIPQGVTIFLQVFNCQPHNIQSVETFAGRCNRQHCILYIVIRLGGALPEGQGVLSRSQVRGYRVRRYFSLSQSPRGIPGCIPFDAGDLPGKEH